MPGTLGIIGWLIVGGLAGWLAAKFMSVDKGLGVVMNIVFGVTGAFLGGLLLSVVGVNTDGAGLLFTFATAVAGACLLIWALRKLV